MGRVEGNENSPYPIVTEKLFRIALCNIGVWWFGDAENETVVCGGCNDNGDKDFPSSRHIRSRANFIAKTNERKKRIENSSKF